MNAPFSSLQGGKEAENHLPQSASSQTGKLPIWVLAAVGLVMIGLVLYSMQGTSQFQEKTRADLAKISEQIGQLQDQNRAGEARLNTLTQELAETRQGLGETKQALGLAKQELGRLPRQIKQETEKTKVELAQALAAKADNTQVEAVKQEAVNKIEQVSTDVGGVRTEVGAVKTDLNTTKVDLEGTKRQLIDVRDILTAAVARNSSELAELRRKGERNYFEFAIDTKDGWASVEDIKLSLAKADTKNHKFNIRILVDDNQLEKKDRNINEPLQFLVGRSRLRYEVVVNWVKKDKVGGYLSIPKDKVLSAEIVTTK
jgi:chromosome segregation ATPase